MLAVSYKGNLFAAALMSERLVAMMALAVSARLPWRGHTAGIAKGLGAYSLFTVLIETGLQLLGPQSRITSLCYLFRCPQGRVLVLCYLLDYRSMAR
jgi:hypothetical protein